MKVTTIAAIAAIATAVTQLFLGLAMGSFSAGSQLELVQTELKLIRKDLQSQYQLIQTKNELYDYRLQILERQQAKSAK
jgi:hypothetical protein